jgi:hypothetical protein
MLGKLFGFVGLMLIILGGAAVSIGYVGGKDAEARRPTAVKIEVRKAPKATARTSKSKPPTPPKIAAPTTAPTVMNRWRRMMIWGGGGMIVGLISIGVSLHERPPKGPRSGADEMLNEPVPF